MILDIRGGNGSGKSFIMHTLLQDHNHEEIRGRCEHRNKDNYLLGYYIPEFDAAIVGKYESDCGGCDGVGSPIEIVRRVKMFADEYTHVLFEGIIVAHAYKRYRELALELADYDYHFLFLDTPVEKCLKRVHQRRKRKERRTGKESRPLYEQGVYDEYNKMVRIWNKMVDAEELQFEALDHTDPFDRIYYLLNSV